MLLHRSAEQQVITALSDTRVVAIQGARQTGKSTLARDIATARGATYITLDDRTQRDAAINDPNMFVRQSPEQLLVIDEVQRAPDLILAIKEVVDVDTRPGQFLLTGSSDLTRGTGIEDSLAGRIEIINLYGLSMIERNEGNGVFFETLRSASPIDVIKAQDYSMTRQDYLQLAIAGGYPEALARSDKGRRDKWFDNYTRQLLSKDVGEANRLRRASVLPKLLRYIASISGRPAVIANIANDISEPRSTVDEYISLLELVFLIDRIPTWSSNLTSRAIKHPKLMFCDSGLLSRQLDAKEDIITDLTSSIAGAVFETFIYSELKKLAISQHDQPDIYHYRDSQQREVDFVIQYSDNTVSLIEVKLSSTVGISDFKSMEDLWSKDKSIRNCTVIYTGNKPTAFSDHQYAIPAQAIWW